MVAHNNSIHWWWWWWWCPRKSLKVCVGSKSWAKVILSTVKLWTILNYAIMKAFSLLILITLLALWNRICCDYALFRSLFMSKDHRWPLHLKFGEIIEKSSMSMVNLRKNIQWWWSSSSKTIENPLQALVSRKKIITIPSSWKNYHRRSLVASRVGHAYAKYAKYAVYAHMRNMRMRIENLIHIFHMQREKLVFLKGNRSSSHALSGAWTGNLVQISE